MFKVNITNVKSALVSGVITAVLGVAAYIMGVGDVFSLDIKTLVNIASISGLTAVVSILKSFLTSDAGNVVGLVNVK